MAVLTTSQRSLLEKTVIKARRLAEAGAWNALRAMAVEHHEPYPHQDVAGRELRNRLRSKGRLLGDVRTGDGKQGIGHLGYELAYEYWHKMLFARFLEANGLLMYSDGVAVSLEDCAELAGDEGFADKWDAAAAYASRMLPAIFRPEDPLMQVKFATEDRVALESLLDGLETGIFTADDSLGWVYQFWQSEAKAAINASGDKIDGARLPAVTQLFTEPYMVHFLIDNTLGAWWIGRHPETVPPVTFAFLRRLEDGSPAAGKFEGWPATTAEVTMLDPCMGSGHFVAAAFPVFATLRMYEEGLSKEEATAKVIAENLHGLELDARCTQIAAFNLALTAWKFCGGYVALPRMHLACSGVAPRGKAEDWIGLVRNVEPASEHSRMENGMRALFSLFQEAPELGSLLDPSLVKADVFCASFEELSPVLKKALTLEKDNEIVEQGVIAAGIAMAGDILAHKYTLQITNVPYLGSSDMSERISRYLLSHFPDSKSDLATVFISRLLFLCTKGGTVCSVMPQNWLFLSSYSKLRQRLLSDHSWDFVVRLGEHAFTSSAAAGAFAALFSISHQKPKSDQVFMGMSVANNRGAKPIYADEKERLLPAVEFKLLDQNQQLMNPDARIVLEDFIEGTKLLGTYCSNHQGLSTGDNPRFRREHWEMPILGETWEPEQSTVANVSMYAGRTGILLWEGGSGQLYKFGRDNVASLHNVDRRGEDAWEKSGIAISQIGDLPASLYNGTKFDTNVAILIPRDSSHLPAVWAYCSSLQYKEAVRKIDQKLNVTNATLVKVPFDLEHWQQVAAEKYPDGLPLPYSDDPTQWLFHGHPVYSEAPLQVALARLLCYRWPAETDENMELAPLARERIALVQAFDHLSDDDGIVCIPPVNGEAPAADRLREYLVAVYGEAWTHQTLEGLLQAAGASKPSLETWLRDDLFGQHCKLFQNRPFIWQVWDGRKDGFSALLNYHLLTQQNLQTLIYTYLGDWIRQCEAKVQNGDSGADGMLSAALALKAALEKILEGEAPYDVFVRWKPLAEQPIGWNPDLNDGVRLNIRPFVEAGVLRKKFNVKWGVDRGKNPAGAHWGEVRDNDLHLGLEEKRGAKG